MTEMITPIKQMEAKIKREITRQYKESFGKGPEETSVKIYDNILILQFDGALTPIEETLRNLPEGENIIFKIRETLVNKNKEYYFNQLEETLHAKVDGARYHLSKEKSTIYVFIIFKDNIA